MYQQAQIEEIFDNKFAKEHKVALKGWVYNSRSSGKVKFLLLRDGGATIQCILFKGSTPDNVLETFTQLTQESAVEVKGYLSQSPKATGGWELQVEDLSIISGSVDYPITPKEHGPAYLLDHRHLWIRSKRQHAILRIRAEVSRAIREFFDDKGFIAFDTPVFTPNACEGTSDLFEINYFDDDKAYLTQSGQLYAEAGAMAFGKVYTFGPTFRAEKSKTRRHLTEFWMIEPEVAFMELAEDMDLAEALIVHVVASVLKNRENELKALERDVSILEKVKGPFPRMSYEEAADILERESKDNFKTGMDFGGGDETILSDKFDRPLIVHRYPSNIKAFYMKEDGENSGKCLCFDMLAPEGYGEIVGGSERETSIETLEKKIAQHELSEEAFKWYLDLRRFGSVPHAGFGLGLERLTGWIAGTKHVRECIPFPRMINRLQP